VLTALAVTALLRTLGAAVARLGWRVEPTSPIGRFAPVALGVLTIGAVGVTTAGLHLRSDEETSAAEAHAVLPVVEEAIGDRPVLLEARSGKGGWIQSALVLELDKQGYEVHAKTTIEGKFPADIAAEPPRDAVRLVVVTDPDPEVEWNTGVEVVADLRYQLGDEGTPIHVVIVSAPLDEPFVTTFATDRSGLSGAADGEPDE
jgi:hypothetical protein